MSLWFILAGLALAALVPLLWPLVRPPRRADDRLSHDIEVYRDQLRELDAEQVRGTIDEAEVAEARREIERRILHAADTGATPTSAGRTSSVFAASVVAVIVPAAAFLLYLHLGNPGLPGEPQRQTAGMASEPERAPALEQMVEQLQARLDKDPDDVEGWRRLGRTQWELRRYAEAAAAYARAVELDDDDPALLTSYGEAMTAAADGMVTPPALAVFRRAHEIDDGNPGARFYIALAELQAGRPQYAYNGWLALARDLPPGSPGWRAVVARLREVADDLGHDLAADLPTVNEVADEAPGPSRADVEAAGEMSDEERQTFIRGMVARLAGRLEESPDDFDGWMRLGRAYRVLGDQAEAAEAYGRAAALRPDDPTPLQAQAAALLDQTEPGELPGDAALEALRALLELQPMNARALWYLGLADARAGRRAAAVDKGQALLALLPPDSDERKNLATAIERLKAAE